MKPKSQKEKLKPTEASEEATSDRNLRWKEVKKQIEPKDKGGKT